MTRALVLTALLALAGGTAAPAQDPNAPVPREALPEGRALLRGAIDALPDVPLEIQGVLVSKSPEGTIEQRLHLEMLLDWQAVPPTARYTLRDNFGRSLKHLAVTWDRQGGEPEYRYLEGDPLAARPLPPLEQAIEGTDISWMDLSLSFLWWSEARTVGREEVRGRSCYVLDLAAPAHLFAGLSGVRLWIDPKINVMLRAESYSQQSEKLRRMDVKGFKKINDRWVIQEIEVESLPSRHKTFLRIEQVVDRERKNYLDREPAAETPLETPAPEPERVDNLFAP